MAGSPLVHRTNCCGAVEQDRPDVGRRRSRACEKLVLAICLDGVTGPGNLSAAVPAARVGRDPIEY
jgi:hypothetical protein